jgi:hypothetical protein
MYVIMEEMVQPRMGLYNPGAGVFGRSVLAPIWSGTEDQIQTSAVPALREGHHSHADIGEWDVVFARTDPEAGRRGIEAPGTQSHHLHVRMSTHRRPHLWHRRQACSWLG